jgi:hypothetical protein
MIPVRQIIPALAVAGLIIALGLCSGCSGLSDNIKAAAGDNATWCLNWQGFGVNATAVRINPDDKQTATVKCPSEIIQGNPNASNVTVQAGGTMVMNQSVQAKP